MVFNAKDNQKCFSINYKDIALSNASGKNEIALEFAVSDTEQKSMEKGDMLCEMRFYVPNNNNTNNTESEEKKRNRKEGDEEEEVDE